MRDDPATGSESPRANQDGRFGPILAVDAATDACSVALAVDGEVVHRHEIAPRMHASRLLDLITEVLEARGVGPADLRAVAWCHGPGSFTGVRIAAGVVQGIAWGAGLPVIGVSTLATLAQGCHRRLGAERVSTALDARMGEVYWGCYIHDADTGLMQPAMEDRVCSPEDVPLASPGVASGTGWQAYQGVLEERVGLPLEMDQVALPEARDLIPHALVRLATGEVGTARGAVPVYLRDRVTG